MIIIDKFIFQIMVCLIKFYSKCTLFCFKFFQIKIFEICFQKELVKNTKYNQKENCLNK